MSLKTRLVALEQQYPGLMFWMTPLRSGWQGYHRWRQFPTHQMLDNLSRLVPHDVRVRLDEADSDFWLSPRSDLFRRIVASGAYEPQAFDLLRRHLKPDGDFLDVGANVGFFTVAASRLLTHGRVLAIEPTMAAHARLMRNIQDNDVADRVIVEQCLVGDHQGQVAINVIPGREEYSSIGDLTHPSTRNAQSATETREMFTIDQLVSRHGLRPKMMKMDIEGAEGLALRGARETLQAHRPVILAEFSVPLLAGFKTPAEQILSYLSELGYHITDPGAPDGIPGRRPFGEILAVPG